MRPLPEGSLCILPKLSPVAATCGAGQTTARLGAPDIAATTRQFLAYVETLLQLGLKVTVLPAAADYPDAHFVEDTAVVPCRNWR